MNSVVQNWTTELTSCRSPYQTCLQSGASAQASGRSLQGMTAHTGPHGESTDMKIKMDSGQAAREAQLIRLFEQARKNFPECDHNSLVDVVFEHRPEGATLS